jgi:hypothetical protein
MQMCMLCRQNLSCKFTVTTQSNGFRVRLRAQGDAAGVQLMLERLQTILFEMKVGERVRSSSLCVRGTGGVIFEKSLGGLLADF